MGDMKINANSDGGKFKLDKFASDAERFLSKQAKTPIIGSLAGVVKIAGGAVQAITALACGIIVGIPLSAIKGDSSILKHSWTHMKHGLGNIAAGTVEAIPGLGTLAWKIRKEINKEKIPEVHVELGQKDKFMPYKSQQLAESRIVEGVTDTTDEHAKLAQNFYEAKISGKKLSHKEKFKIKKQVVRLSVKQLKDELKTLEKLGKIPNKLEKNESFTSSTDEDYPYDDRKVIYHL